MSFPRYPEYKDSGIPWAEVIPTAWNVLPLYVIANECDDSNQGMQEKNLLSLSYGRIVQKDINSNDGLLPESFETYQIVQPNDIVLRLTDLQNDQRSLRSALVGQAGIITSAYLAVRPQGVVPRFLSYLLRAYDTTKVFYSMGGGLRQSMKFADLKRLPMVLPTQEEQGMIATFLDRETAKIDALVAEQEKLIALLQEKRQAVISHAVTKGLDPDVPMKDSGVEWLGEVPGHWDAITLRRCALAVQTGGTPSADNLSESLDEGFVWYTPGDFGSSLKLSTSTRRIANEAVASGEAKVFPPKSVLIVSIGATLGKVGFAQDTSSANQQINAVIPGSRVDGYFLAWSLSVKTETMRFLSNASTIGIMNQEKTKEIWIALPPREEQTAIATFLDRETAKLDTLMAEARTAITLLQERRAALISAAVTGQINVRGLVGSADAPDFIADSALPVSARD